MYELRWDRDGRGGCGEGLSRSMWSVVMTIQGAHSKAVDA